jgi:phage nucleotide-binding protein
MIKKSSEQLENSVVINTLIYGQPGIGKTTFALSAPKPLIIDCDGGLNRINQLDMQDNIPVKSWEDILSIKDENLTHYDTIIIDTVGKALDFLTDYLVKNNPKLGKADGSLGLNGYGALKTTFSQYLKSLRLLGKNIVLIAHDKEEKKGDEIIIRPDIVGGSLPVVLRDMDMIGYCESINNKRTITFDSTDKSYGKNTCNLPSLIEIGNYRDGKKCFKMSDVVAAYEKKIDDGKKLSAEYTELLSDADLLIDSIETPEQADEALANIQKVQVIWDSLIKSKTKLMIKVKKLGFTFNAKSKKFETAVTPATNE